MTAHADSGCSETEIRRQKRMINLECKCVYLFCRSVESVHQTSGSDRTPQTCLSSCMHPKPVEISTLSCWYYYYWNDVLLLWSALLLYAFYFESRTLKSVSLNMRLMKFRISRMARTFVLRDITTICNKRRSSIDLLYELQCRFKHDFHCHLLLPCCAHVRKHSPF
jgi:hypothetical protein